MAKNLIDLYNHILRYNGNDIYIAFKDETQELYFNAAQVCKILEYNNYHKALKNNVPKSDIFYLRDIVKHYKFLYKNVQGNTKFINEAGLNELLLSSKKEIAINIRKWISHEVMPELRKYGEYKLNHKLKKQIRKLKEKIKEQQNQIGILEHNLKKPKIKKGKMVYLIREIRDSMLFNEYEIIYVKFGRTKKMDERKPAYDTAHINRVQILKSLFVNDPITIERCVIKKMEYYQYQHKKEMFKCDYDTIINVIADCIKFYEGVDIDKTPDIDKLYGLKRLNDIKFNTKDVFLFKVMNDDSENDENYENDNSENDKNDDNNDNSENEYSSDEDATINLQKGGNIQNKIISYKYLFYKLQFLELQYLFL